MRIFITGATGLIGRRLVLDRLERGDRVVVLSRDAARAERLFATRANPNIEAVAGNPMFPGPWQDAIDGCDAVVHLAGAGVADRRWTPAYRREIVESRIDSTHQVVEAIETAAVRPRVLVSASAIGFYGATGDVEVDEHQGKGADDFLADLSAAWEEQALRADPVAHGDRDAAAGARTRVVLLRTGLLLDARGGLLARLLRPFRMFVGGPIGRGLQYMSWIHWADAVGLIDHALRREDVRGPLNLVAPVPVTNRTFSSALGRALARPSWLPVPPLALRIALGPFAHYALMSQRVLPTRAERTGYQFRFRTIDGALEDLLERNGAVEAVPAPFAAQASVPIAPSAAASGGSASRPPLPPPPHRPRLVVISADGALLRRDRKLPAAMVPAVRAARQAGIVVVLASSRAPRVVAPLVRTFELESPLIAYSGAVIWSPVDREARFHQGLDPAVASEVVATARRVAPDIRIAVEVLDHWFTDRFVVSGEGPSASEPDEIGALDRFLTEPVSQLDLLGSADEVARVRQELARELWRERRISVFEPTRTTLQVVHPLADKGIAVQRIADRMGIRRDAVVAIGSDPRDAGLLEWCGHAYAIATAPERIRKLANAEIAGPEDNGTARALQACISARPREAG